MIIDYSQKKEGLDISYVSADGFIKTDEILLDNYYNYVECDEYDPNKEPLLRSFYNKPIKKEIAHYFTHHNINEFFNRELQQLYPENFKIFDVLHQPSPFSCDIETDITEKYGYSDQYKVENSICSISFTDINLNSIYYIVKNPEHPIINALDKGYIAGILQESLKHHYDRFEYKFDIRVFDTEIEMLRIFVDNYRY